MDTNECQKHSSIWSRNVYSPCLVCRAEKAEAERDQARADARVLAKEVARLWKGGTPNEVIAAAVERNKP